MLACSTAIVKFKLCKTNWKFNIIQMKSKCLKIGA